MRFNPPRALKWLSGSAVTVGSVVLFKEMTGGSNYSGDELLKGKTVIVTGANTGIGMETALEMARRKARVIMACRDMRKCKRARKAIMNETLNKNVLCQECDLASFQSVRHFAQEINASEGSIDLLINNAAVMRCPKKLSADAIELQLATNHMGHFLLTQLLLHKIKSTAGSRIVTVSSVAHKKGNIKFGDLNSKEYDADEAYNQSKLANVLFTKRLARELQGSDVVCSAVNPGLCNTELARHLPLYKSWTAMVLLRPVLWLLLKTARHGAQTTLYAALSPDAVTPGAYYSNQKEEPVAEAARDQIVQDRLWDVSVRWTGIA